MRNIFLWLPMRCLGCFDVGATSLEKATGLLRIRDLLQHRKTVLIFPEGKITRHASLPAIFEKGINFLVGDTTPVILIRLTGMSSWSFLNFTSRHQTQIRFSEMLPPGMPAHEKFEHIKEFFGKEESI